MKVAVSLSAHESELALLDQCFNYFCVGYVDAVVIHVNPYAKFSRLLFLRLAQASPFGHRIFLNNFATGEMPARSDYRLANSVLHRAHVANFQYLNAVMEFDYVCLDASNTLLLKPGLRDFVARGETCVQQAIQPHWTWTNEMLVDVAPQFFGDSLCNGQHEGTVYARATMEKMVQEIAAYECALSEHIGKAQRQGEFPREEVILPSAYHRVAGKAPNQTPYVYLPWERDINLAWSEAQVEDVLKGRTSLPEPCYSVKRIPRDMNDPARVAIGNHFGYRRVISETVEAVKAANATNAAK